MKGTTVLLFAFLAITTVFARGNMQLQFGSYVARAVGTAGRVSVVCTGGSGDYNYQFTSLPAGWSANGNILTIPDINSIRGQSVSIGAQIRDARTGEVLNTNIILTINGVRVAVQEGAAIGGTFGGASSSSQSSVTIDAGASVNVQSSSAVVTSLYEGYEGLPAGAQIQRSSQSYVSPSGNPIIPNPAPAIIANAQAEYNAPRDANTITVDDVKRVAIFNRQINANKAVANLVSIVRRLTANVNAATNDLTVLTQILADAEQANANCQGVIFDLSNTKAKIENAIADRQTSIADVNGQIAALRPEIEDLQNQLQNLINERTDIENDRSPNADRLAALEQELANCRAQRQALQDRLQGVRDQIADTNTDIQNTRDGASAAPGEIQQINRQIPIIDNRIEDLRNQIADAEAEKAQLLADRDAAQAIIDAADREVARLENVLAGLEAQIPDLTAQIAAKQANCDAIEDQLDAFRNELAQIQSNYATLQDEIAGLEALLNEKQTEADQLAASIAGIPNELRLLRAEHDRVDNALRRQFFLCEATADDVRRAKQNVQAMRIRLDSDTEALRTANTNLEAARREKELADIAVEEIIAVYTDALPFSVVPDINANQQQQRSEVVIGDLTSYLSSAYGAGVDPARPSTVTSLYPLSVTTISTIAGDQSQNLYSFDCSTGVATSGRGVVHSVQPGMIQVDTDSGMVDLQIAGCTNLETTRRNQVLGTGDQIYYSCAPSGNACQAHSVTNA